MKFWMVVIKPHRTKKGRLRRKHRPTVMHRTLAAAFTEAKRLAEEVRRPFFVMEVIGEVAAPDGVDIAIEQDAAEAAQDRADSKIAQAVLAEIAADPSRLVQAA